MSERDSRELKDKISVPATESVEVVEGAEKAAVVEAVRQVQALEAFGMQTAEQLAAKAGEAGVDADVSTALQSVQTEALQAMLQFAGQKFDAIGSDAKLALVKARDWAARRIESVRETLELHRIFENSASLRTYKGGPHGLIRLYKKSVEGRSADGKNESHSYGMVDDAFTQAVENLPTDPPTFRVMAEFWRDTPKGNNFSKDLSRIIVSKFVTQSDEAVSTAGTVTKNYAIFEFPDVYAASARYSSGAIDPKHVHGGKNGMTSVFAKLRTLGDIDAMASFSPLSFEADGLAEVRDELLRAYAEKNPRRILHEMSALGPALAALSEGDRDRVIRSAIDAVGYMSNYDFFDVAVSPFVSDENTARLAERITSNGYKKEDVVNALWGDKKMIAILSPKISDALGIPPGERDALFEKILGDDPAFLRDNAVAIQLSEAQRTSVENRIIEFEIQTMSEDLRMELQFLSSDIRGFAIEEFRRIASGDLKKARDLFFGESFVPIVADEPELGKVGIPGANMELERRAEAVRFVSESPALREIFVGITDHFSATALRAFAKRVKAVGIESSERFFATNRKEWEQNPESRWPLMEEFLIDAQEALARTKAEDPIEMGEAQDDGSVAVTLEIPSLRQDPSWYDESRVVSYPVSTDDKDYRLPAEFALIENLPSHSPQDVRALYRAMVSGNRGSMRILVEKMAGLGEIPPEKFEFIASSLEAAARLWDAGAPTGDATMDELREKLSNVEKLIPLPDSSKPLTIHNQMLNRDRVIPSFTGSIRSGYLTEVALAYAVQLSRKPSVETTKVAEHLIVVETQARALYKNVVQEGVPIFRDFVSWANEEHRKAGPSYPGEFYVGRDTLMTLHEGANAMRWGKMSGEQRRSLTVHVDVSRELQRNADANPELKAMMVTWLEQEGVTEKMLGVDGGYSGNSPKYVFNAMSGHELPDADLDKRIRLVDTKNSARQFNSRMSYDGLVSWMEVLPKFTDRSEGLAKSEFGKYYVVTSRRSPIERTLAWTVQQAVWRELINYDAVAHAIRNVIEPRGVPSIPESVKPPPPPPPLHEFGPYIEDTEEVPDDIPT